jgi:hypothetical protein
LGTSINGIRARQRGERRKPPIAIEKPAARRAFCFAECVFPSR